MESHSSEEEKSKNEEDDYEDESIYIKIKNLNDNYVQTWKKIIQTPKNEEELPTNYWPKIKLLFDKEDDINKFEIEKHKIFIDTLLRYSEINLLLFLFAYSSR